MRSPDTDPEEARWDPAEPSGAVQWLHDDELHILTLCLKRIAAIDLSGTTRDMIDVTEVAKCLLFVVARMARRRDAAAVRDLAYEIGDRTSRLFWELVDLDLS